MIGKRYLTVFVTLLLTFVWVVGTVQIGLAQEQQGDQAGQQAAQPSSGVDLGSGKQGVFIPSGASTGITVENINQRELGWVRGTLQSRAVRLEAPGGTTQRAYVFFNLNGRERRAWNQGELKIVYRPLNSRAWQTCNAFAVGTTSQSGNGQQGPTRLACLTNTYNAVYAMVRVENDAQTSQTTSQGSQIAQQSAVIPQTGSPQQSSQQQTGQTGATQQGDQPSGTQQNTGANLGSGNQGVFLPGGNFNNAIQVEKINKQELGWVRGNLVGKAVSLMAQGRQNARAYVFFTLKNRDRQAWNNGNLRIVYRPLNSRTWQTCNAIAVGTTSQTGTGPQGPTRLACLTKNYNAVYALVRTDQGNE